MVRNINYGGYSNPPTPRPENQDLGMVALGI